MPTRLLARPGGTGLFANEPIGTKMNPSLRNWLVLGLLLGTAVYAIAEDITLTTYYPLPRGSTTNLD